jgi:hypothetical protein
MNKLVSSELNELLLGLGIDTPGQTIGDIVMWLYEKHGIWISVECDCYGELWYSSLYSASKRLWEDIDKRHKVISAHHSFPNEHDTSIKAYEAAIEYTLNNLI